MQNDCGWNVPAVHDTAVPHDTEVAACVQPLAPLQVPVLPQGGLAVHWPLGAAVPDGSGVQVPGVVPLQVSQVPHIGLPQQTVLMQLPLMHWFAAVHVCPLGFSAQFFGAVPWQVKGERQSPSAVHDVLHAFVPHTYGVQLDAVGAAQPPEPLQ